MLTRRGSRGQAATAGRPTARVSQSTPDRSTDALTVTWIGHTSFLIQCGGLNLLTDPIWSDRASPLSFVGPRRVVPPGLSLVGLPPIDTTFISHDHYDHLDDRTVRRLIEHFPAMRWLAPLKVGKFLRRRGAMDVVELDWWEERDFGRLAVACTPAQHFSGRLPWNRNSTLWCGWVARIGERRIFFAGDTGLHGDFKEIAARFGPFDAAILPIGAYEPRWFMAPVHMNPEDTVIAYQDLIVREPLGSCVLVASHWGTFRLTDEPLDEPPALMRENWARAGLRADNLWIMDHGEARSLSAG